MKRRISVALALIDFLAVASAGIAQNADKNTAAPTKNDLRLHLTEPVEGVALEAR